MKKLIIRLSTITLLLVILYIIYNNKSIKERELLNFEMNAKIISIYQNKNEHNSFFVKFSNGYIESFEYPYKIGDSISKKKGDSVEYIFTNGKGIIKHNLLESARKNGF